MSEGNCMVFAGTAAENSRTGCYLGVTVRNIQLETVRREKERAQG